MKKLISINDLDVGMFVDAEVVAKRSNGDEQQFLVPQNAVCTGSSAKRARLTGKMGAKIKTAGGLLINSDAIINSLTQIGYKSITIDTEKGADVPETVKPLTDPSRKPPPEGRLCHYDEEIERAKEIRDETTDTLKNALDDVASGKDLDKGKIDEAGEVIFESIVRNVDAMVSLTRIKQHDPYTAMHCMNVCTLVVAMAIADGVDASLLPLITTATLLHDVGKTRVPLEVLNKPGRFEPEELAEMRRHATYSGDIMNEMGGFTEESIAIATQHHEMMDGSGYPLSLKGDEIHPYARLTAVADVYDALTAKRVYKPAMPMYQALLRIHQNKGTEFEERAVDLFVRTLGLYPVGSLVELNNKEQAVVFEPNPANSRKPTLGILTMANQKPRAAPFIVNLSRRSEAEDREIVKVLDPDQVGLDIEKIMEDVGSRGERTERMRR